MTQFTRPHPKRGSRNGNCELLEENFVTFQVEADEDVVACVQLLHYIIILT
jgi:hypothetical protein